MATKPRALRPGHWLAALAPLFVLASGCVTTGLTLWKGEPAPPSGMPCQILANWKSEVYFTPNPAPGANGAMIPGLVGRLYLFGPKIDSPFTCEGSLVVDLVDETAGPNGTPAVIEEWRFDPATLKRLVVRDFIGWGYTLFLPLEHYRPEGLRGHLKVAFNPVNGGPLYTENLPTVFHPQTDDGPVITTQMRQVAPVMPGTAPMATVQVPQGGVGSPAAAVQTPQGRVMPLGMAGTNTLPARPQNVQPQQAGLMPLGMAGQPLAPAGPQVVSPTAAVQTPQGGVMPLGMAGQPVAPAGPQTVQPQQGGVMPLGMAPATVVPAGQPAVQTLPDGVAPFVPR